MKKQFAAVGEYFREKRESKELSQKDLADRLKYSSAQMISNWERGLCAPPLDAISKLIPLLGVSRTEVLDLMLTEHKKFLDRSLQPRKRRAA